MPANSAFAKGLVFGRTKKTGHDKGGRFATGSLLNIVWNRRRLWKDIHMTGKADFTPEEWELVREGPPTAGMALLLADKGGTFRETWALAKPWQSERPSI